MTSAPSDINLIINNLATIDKENFDNDHDTNTSENDKEKISKENGGYSLMGNDINDYVEIYNKFRPYRVLKIINWILLILLAVGSVLTTETNLGWSSDYWTTNRWNHNIIDETFAVGQIVLVVLGLISLIVHCFAKNLFKAAVFSLMDICFFLFSVPILFISNIVFTNRSISLYRWLRPKIANFNYTFEAYVDITEAVSEFRRSFYDGVYRRMDKDKHVLDAIDVRKKEILLHVLIDPTYAVLTAITLILNIFMIFCLYKKISNVKLWMDINEYLTLFPKCSSIEQKYAILGKTKMIQWLLPLFPLLGYVYIPSIFRSTDFSTRHFWAPFIIYFIHWLLYYCTLHLRCPKGKNGKPIRLSYLFVADLILSYFFVFLFIICLSIRTHPVENFFFFILTIFYGIFSLKLTFIYLRNKQGLFNFKLPISIKINFEINRKSKNDEEQNN